MLSVIIPAYNEERMIRKTNAVIGELLDREKIAHELIFVNDGSKDGTWEELSAVCREYPATKAVSFSRNFGKEAAMFAGLAVARGDCGVIIDCDLQHPPEAIVKMYRLWEEGYEVVEGVKSDRGKESAGHRLAAKSFYRMISRATGIDMSRASDFKLLDRKVIDALLAMPEKQVFFRALSSWVGFKSTTVAFEVRERQAGETKWSTGALIRYALNNITSFSTAPLHITTILGVLFLIFSAALGVQTLISYWMGHSLEGFTTVIILLLLIGSLLMISLGIVGYYIAKIYDEIKGRPKYIISQMLNGAGEKSDGADQSTL